MVDTASLALLFGDLLGPASLAGLQPADALAALRRVNPAAAARLDDLAALEHGWFEEESPPITFEARSLAAAALLLHHSQCGDHCKPPHIDPMADGGIELEWQGASGKQLLLTIPPEGVGIQFLKPIIHTSGVTFEAEGAIPSDAKLSELLTWLTAEPQ